MYWGIKNIDMKKLLTESHHFAKSTVAIMTMFAIQVITGPYAG
jgi:hypothetical protein